MGKKLNKDVFIERSIQKHGNLFDYSKVIYKNTSTKVEIICKEHGVFFQSPYNHMSGQKCPSCSGRPIYTTKIFIENSKKIHGNKYDYSKSEYISSKTKVVITCPTHGDFEQSPNSHLRGNGCQDCYNKRRGDSLRHTTESFIKKSKKIHGEKYDYRKVNYVNIKKKVTIICPEHGEFEQSPGDHLIGQGCLRCSKHPVFDTLSFIEDSIKIHGETYNYSKVKYVNTKTKVKIICPEHGEFEQRPSNHLQGQGCNICGIINTGLSQRSSTEEFIKDSIKIHGDKYDYSKVNYVKNNLKVKIICPIHGEFEQIPNTHLNGGGCTECGYEKVSKDLTLPFDVFYERSRKIHGKTYDYDENSYKSYVKKMTIICPIHGEFKLKPHTHISSEVGCKKCGYIRGSEKTRMKIEEFVLRSNEVHENKYDYSKVNYINSMTKVEIICPRHGIFLQRPSSHINHEQGCPKCYSSRGEKLIRQILTNEKIDFEEQKTLSWLKIKSRLRCDFYLPKYKIVIEYNGRQHYMMIDHFGGQSGFERTKERDKRKRKILKQHEIKLIEIRFDEKNVKKYLLSRIYNN